MGPLALTLLLAAALAGFATLTARKLLILRALQPDMRWDRPAARLASVLRNGFLQQRMIRRDWKPGLMHATIFAGFLVLLARKVELLVMGYHESFVYGGLVGDVFASVKDVVELALLVALAYAFYRRYVRRPVRLEPNREALLILCLITAIVVTDLAFDAFRFARFAATDAAIAHERAFAFAGSALATAVSGWSAATLAVGYHAAYWTQLVVVFAFLVLLPIGEHFHIVTALPALFFRRGAPARTVPGVDLDAIMADDSGAEMKIGVAGARDLTWKEGLDVFTCTECGRCKDACPTFVTGKPLSMKWVNDALKRHLVENRAALAHGDASPALLVPEVITPDALWACTTCGYCESACPIELEHLPRFFRMRQHQVMIEGAFPHELKAVFEAYEAQSNPWGLSADTRGDWARGLDVPIARTAADIAAVDYLFYVGSAESFDPRGQRIARAFVQVMRAAGVRFAILGAGETSTGECVRRAGNEMLFQALAKGLVEQWNALGVRRVVTCDPHAYNSLRNEYPAFGGHYEVLHHTTLIARWLAEGRLAVRRASSRVVLHDPCYLGRQNGEFAAPRAILAALSVDTPPEITPYGEKAMCCGAGGARMWQEERIGTRINIVRAGQALAAEPAAIATACPYCAVMLGDGVAALDASVPVRDVAELVLEALVTMPAAEEIAVAS